MTRQTECQPGRTSSQMNRGESRTQAGDRPTDLEGFTRYSSFRRVNSQPQTGEVYFCRDHALVESAVSSNRIEGVTIEQAHVRPVVIGRGRLRDRDEEEVRGYRDALRLVHERHARLPASEKTIREVHRLSRANIGDAGRYRAGESEIVEIQADGRRTGGRVQHRPRAGHKHDRAAEDAKRREALSSAAAGTRSHRHPR